MLQEGKSWKGKKYNKRGNLIHTITADSGKEFAKHQEIAKELDISFYFCKPYHSWERGANENSPQKRLGYLTPNEKFNLLLTNQNSGCICKLNSPNQKYRLTAKGIALKDALKNNE